MRKKAKDQIGEAEDEKYDEAVTTLNKCLKRMELVMSMFAWASLSVFCLFV